VGDASQASEGDDVNDLQNYITMLHHAGVKYKEETNKFNDKHRYVIVGDSYVSVASFVQGRLVGMDVGPKGRALA
jgi:hypothetical protein